MTSHRRFPLVLTVDDDTTTNGMTQTILTWTGFQTAQAFDVAGALAGILEQQPDLILLDVSLPDGSGFDFCRRIQGVAFSMERAGKAGDLEAVRALLPDLQKRFAELKDALENGDWKPEPEGRKE